MKRRTANCETTNREVRVRTAYPRTRTANCETANRVVSSAKVHTGGRRSGNRKVRARNWWNKVKAKCRVQKYELQTAKRETQKYLSAIVSGAPCQPGESVMTHLTYCGLSLFFSTERIDESYIKASTVTSN